jgi:hypothetical protein
MALKTVDPTEIVEFIPKSERESKEPTTVYFGRLAKREYDAYLNSLTEIKKNKVVSKHEKSAEYLFRRVLRAKDGIFIKNGYVDGKFVKEIRDIEQAINFLLGIQDLEAVNEIEAAMRGQSQLDEDDEKNSAGQ